MLPEKAAPGKFFADDTQHITAGTYWRYVGEDEPQFSKFEIHEHGLILLLTEVRVVDEDIHTLVLAPHPTWESGGRVRVLLEEFLQKWVIEPNGEALREIELAEVMDRIREITGRISADPSEKLLLPFIEEEKAKAQAGRADAHDASGSGAIIPAALLPSQDVVAAQRKIENQLAEMNARAAYIQNLTNQMQGEMRLVAGFQQEKVGQSLASISDVTNQAKSLLKNVKTMRLFLGEESETIQLTSGAPAAPDEPVNFMQSLLFLDEEVFIEGQMIEGFNHSNTHDLKDIFERYPSIRDRMMPYPRCVVLARLRRKSRPMDWGKPMTISDLFQKMAEDEADRRVLMFIRNGENVHLVVADEQTSKAERLFPSKAEIDRIFTARTYGRDEPSREISVQSIEYSYKREEHDDKALFYKRFLLLLWGLHEREGVFGDFLPKGENWLKESIHNEKFRFVHDDEIGLSDGKPSVTEFIKNMNKHVTSGSRIAVDWDTVMDPYVSPHLFEEGRINNYRKISPVKRFEVTPVFLADGQLITKCTATSNSWRSDGLATKNYSIPVTVERRFQTNMDDGSNIISTEQSPVSGFLCLDNVSLEDLDYYMHSRANRKNYLSYIQLFSEARRLLASEVKTFTEVLSKLRKIKAELSADVIKEALTFWRKSKPDWRFPEKPAEYNLIAKMAATIMDKSKFAKDDVLQIFLKSNGNVLQVRKFETELLSDHGTGLVEVTELQNRKIGDPKVLTTYRSLLGDWSLDKKMLLIDEPDPEGAKHCRLHATRRVNRDLFQGGDEIDDILVALDGIKQGKSEDNIEKMKVTSLDQAKDLLDEFCEYSRADKSKFVASDEYGIDLGLALVKVSNDDDLEARILSVSVNLLDYLWSEGFEAQVEETVLSLYEKPIHKLAKLRRVKHGEVQLKMTMKSLDSSFSIEDQYCFSPDFTSVHTTPKKDDQTDTLEQVIFKNFGTRYSAFFQRKPLDPDQCQIKLICSDKSKAALFEYVEREETKTKA